MKERAIAMLILAIAVAPYILIWGLSWTEERLVFLNNTIGPPGMPCKEKPLNIAPIHSVRAVTGRRSRLEIPRRKRTDQL